MASSGNTEIDSGGWRSSGGSSAGLQARLLKQSSRRLLGRVVGQRYHVTELIGSGGMSTVYEAIDLETGNTVALKALLARFFTGEALRRFRQEVSLAQRIQHPNICKVHLSGVDSGTPFIVMERLRGTTLTARIKSTGPLPVAEAISIQLQLLDVLSSLHQARVLHRDVKPSNIIITTAPPETPTIKVFDFGLSRILPAIRSTRLPVLDEEDVEFTRTNIIPGTPPYLSPEQIAGAKDLDERVDVWAAGLVFYEMLTGHRPFDGTSAQEVYEKIVHQGVPAVSDLRSDVPYDVEAVLARATAKARAYRFHSAGAFREAIVSAWAKHRAEGITRGNILKRPSSLRG